MADPSPPVPRLVLELSAPRWFWACASVGLLLWGFGTFLRAGTTSPTAEQVLREQAVLDAARRLEQRDATERQRLDSVIDATTARR